MLPNHWTVLIGYEQGFFGFGHFETSNIFSKSPSTTMDFQHFTCASPKMWQPTPKQQFKEKTMRNSEDLTGVLSLFCHSGCHRNCGQAVAAKGASCKTTLRRAWRKDGRHEIPHDFSRIGEDLMKPQWPYLESHHLSEQCDGQC